MFTKIYLVTVPVFFLIDMFWLGFVARSFYKNQLGFLMRENVNWTAAIIFYLVFIAGLVFFVINPALAKSSMQYALFAGALFGLIAYATYDLTNLATIKDWPILVTLVDLAWGAVLSASVSGISFLLVNKFFL